MTASPARFRDRSITFANGSVGHNVDIPSANPSNYYQAISRPADMARVTIDGKLFLPPRKSDGAALPLVIVTPGSLGVAASPPGARGDPDRHRHRRLRARPVRRARRRLHRRQPDAILVRRQRLRRAGGLEGAERARPDRCNPHRRAGAQPRRLGRADRGDAALRRSGARHGARACRPSSLPIPGAATSSSTPPSAPPRCAS